MNLRSKLVVSMGLLGLLFLTLPGSMRADTIYNYTGNPYTTCDGSYLVGSSCGPYALSITFDTTMSPAQLENLPYTDITATIKSFSFTDGSGLSINQLDGFAYIAIQTNATGLITGWQAFGCINPPYDNCPSENSIYPNSGSPFDESITPLDQPNGSPYGYGYSTILSPRGWTPGVPSTPEPSTNLLLGTGLVGLLALATGVKR